MLLATRSLVFGAVKGLSPFKVDISSICAKQTLEMFYIDRVLNTGSYFKRDFFFFLILFHVHNKEQLKLGQIPLRKSRNGIEMKSPCDEICTCRWIPLYKYKQLQI